MSTDFDKFAILESFLDEVGSYLPEIEAHLDRLQQRPGDRDAIEEAYRLAHTIAGSAAMMDFPDLAHVGQGMEAILGNALDGTPPLDAPTIGLLRRSQGRLSRLLANARTGAPGADIVKEDDDDRAAARGSVSVATGAPASAVAPLDEPETARMAQVPQVPPAQATSPKLPEWLQAFGPNGQPPVTERPTVPPNGATGANGAWDESMPTGPMPAVAAAGSGPLAPPAPATPATADATFDDMLRGFRGASGPLPPSAATAPSGPLSAPMPSQTAEGAAVDAEQAARALSAISPAWEELHVNELAVTRQVAALRDVIVALREAAQATDDERGELRSFLDGSKDAVDRLEEWAGQSMGLDLRNSPEHVRRYLPLSVIWVTSTRLKRLVTLLNNTSRHLTASQEDITESLRELHDAITQVGGLFTSVAAVAGSANPGASGAAFSATVAQVAHFAWTPPAAEPRAPEPVVDAAAEGAATDLPPGARAEMERTVREELRRELEDEVRGEVAAELRREESARIRQELEIQVRRQMLADLTPGLGGSGSLQAARSGLIMPDMPSMEERAAKPVRVGEQSPEALDVFQEEADEHLQHIALGLRQLQANQHDREALQSVRRATHTLKGAAGMMGFSAIQQLAHASEDLLDRLMDGTQTFTPEALGILLETADALEKLISGSVSAGGEAAIVDPLQRRYGALLGTPTRTPSGGLAAPRPAAHVVAPSAAAPAEHAADPDLSVRIRLSKLDELITMFGDMLQNRSVMDERLSRLSRMVADTAVVSQRLGELGGQLETRFEVAALQSGRPAMLPIEGAPTEQLNALGGLQPRFGGAVNGGRNGGPAHLGDFDELELDRYTEFHRLSRGLSESVADMGTLSGEMESMVREIETIFARETRLGSAFQDRLLKARLVPLQSLVPRLYRASSASALRQSKEVEFYVQGGETEVDRTVYEEIADPLQHLVRNAVVHGIEPPDARVRAGKAREGAIYLSAAEEGNQVVITVRDDGAGIDAEKLRIAAIGRGLIDARAHLTQAESLDLMFMPGMSTTTKVDEESGRGVGLDVVRDAVTRLRGTIEVESTPGQGTTFTLRIPVSLQIMRVVLAKVGQQVYAIPMSVVEQIGRLDYYERSRVPGPPAIEVRGNVYPLAYLASYLDQPPAQVDAKSPVLLYGSGRQRLALILDSVPGRQEVVVKSLGPHLKNVMGVGGATVLGDGRVVLILNLPELLAKQPRVDVVIPTVPEPTSSQPRLSAAAPSADPGPQLAAADIARLNTGGLPPVGAASAAPAYVAPTTVPVGGAVIGTGRRSGRLSSGPGSRRGYVLVVDDSPSVRRVVSNMLKSHGWEVQTARDGIEALDVVARQTPAAVLLDIEMPRMDGYELLATLRSQAQYAGLPLIVITSRAAAKHQQRAIHLGANAYVVKPYQDEELLKTLDELTAQRR
ncbi:MAG TPA: Hpt domain-containing protein [Ktedonobacterales bacterium]|nr:Hpt domain-containing protein [Ktedonobacterales bacterium]